MEFKKGSLKLILFITLLIIFILGLIIWKFSTKTDPLTSENTDTSPISSFEPTKDLPVRPVILNPSVVGTFRSGAQADTSQKEAATIQGQLDRDREEQKQTKYLKIKLEQTDLELEQEKALTEIEKLKIENKGAFKEPVIDGQKNIPEVIVEFIGGDSVKKEAILSIAGSNYQVKEKSSPVDNVQVVSISDSSVTLHFSTPQELTKTIDYKPE